MSIMKRIWFLLFFFYSMALNANETPWTGKWHVSWPEGFFVTHLVQHGSDVNGTFEPSHGLLRGIVKGNTLTLKTLNDNNISNTLLCTMGESHNSFFGNDENGVWLGGIRVEEDKKFNLFTIKRSSPGALVYSFLALGNSVRNGNYENLQKAIDLLLFTPSQQKLSHSNRMVMIRTFFQILDECTVTKRILSKNDAQGKAVIWLEQVGSDVKIPLYFTQEEKSKRWKLKIPEYETLEKQLHALLKARDKYEVDPKDNLKLSHPRATMRTLYEQYDRWDTGGKKYVISTMNLSEIDPAIHEWQAPLLAYYLKSVLDRISYVIYQEIPNDPKSKKPYVHFYHSFGNIVIAPYTVEGKTVWQFTPKTLSHISKLFQEMDNVKERVPTKMIEDNSLYFDLKKMARNLSPLLIKEVYHTEVWQIGILIIIVLLALFICLMMKFIVFKLFKSYSLTKRWTEEMITLQYLRPMQIVVFGIVLLYCAHLLGLSNALFFIIKSFSYLLMVIGTTWILYNLISMIFTMMQIHASKTSTDVDEIIISLAGTILRVLIITAALFLVAEIFNIPYKTVLAGLGIGGLAFAIAAKDTIANFFGSAIIIADRPFKTGDRIQIGSNIGKIINVGIRSTKIRTTEDTILTVPNHNITSEMIDNHTAREAMRIDTEFFFNLETSKTTLDDLDRAISSYLKEDKGVDSKKIILVGVNDYTKRGIVFGVSCFVKATTLMGYSELRHRIITELASIIKEHDVELIMITQDFSDAK